jgi:hypothetical protein
VTDWTAMDPAAFGRDAKPVQLALMLTEADGTVCAPDADPMGTLDLFGASDD